jgi:hypothetical protein
MTKADIAAAIKDAIEEALAPAIEKALAPAITKALAPVLARMDKLDARMDKMDARLDKLDTRLDKLDARLDQLEATTASMGATVARLDAARANEDVRRFNSVRPVGAPLMALPFAYDGTPWPAHVQQPGRMLDLAVSGSEQLPGGGKPNWNRGNSRRFLATAMAPLGDESDGEDEGSIKSRTSRLRVVQLMGGSFERVTGAVFAMH